MKEEKRHTVQLLTAVALVIFGILLVTAGFCVEPVGQIHPSVLTAFGETLTFSGSIIGLDYSYKKKRLEKSDEPNNHQS